MAKLCPHCKRKVAKRDWLRISDIEDLTRCTGCGGEQVLDGQGVCIAHVGDVGEVVEVIARTDLVRRFVLGDAGVQAGY